MSLFVGLRDCAELKDIKEPELKAEFSKFGDIERCELKTSHAFITFKSDGDAEKAVAEWNGKIWRGGKCVRCVMCAILVNSKRASSILMLMFGFWLECSAR